MTEARLYAGLPARVGWVVMESPAVFALVTVFGLGPQAGERVPLVLLAMWLAHYLQRTFVFSLLLRGSVKRQAVLTVVMANVFNLLNATGNAAALADRPLDLAFGVGVALFAVGFALNVHSDHRLRSLRAPGESGYKIPYGGGFTWVSAPNYLGEIVEWIGFALAAQTLAAWAFAAFTFANLAPRALANHRWYREKFPDYPGSRRALIPFLW